MANDGQNITDMIKSGKLSQPDLEKMFAGAGRRSGHGARLGNMLQFRDGPAQRVCDGRFEQCEQSDHGNWYDRLLGRWVQHVLCPIHE